MCEHKRIAKVSGKTDDRCYFAFEDRDANDYPPKGVGIGGGSYIKFDYCLDCGQILSDQFPVTEETLEEVFEN